MKEDESIFTLHNLHTSGIRAGTQKYLLYSKVSSPFQRLGDQGNSEVFHDGGRGGINNNL